MKIEGEHQSGLVEIFAPEPEQEFPVLVAKALVERTRASVLVDLTRIKLGFPQEVFVEAAQPVIEAYAGFVQLLPGSVSGHDARPGGRLLGGLSITLRALDYRRGQMLPRGAAPEIIGANAHRWTYAVFVAALLYGVGNIEARFRVLMRVDGRTPRAWAPRAGSMLALGASSYRVEVLEASGDETGWHPGLAGRLFHEWVPAPVLAWIAEDSGLMSALRACLSTEGSAPCGALSELVLRAATGTSPSRLQRRPEAVTEVSMSAIEEETATRQTGVFDDATRSAQQGAASARAPSADSRNAGGQTSRVPNIRSSEVVCRFVEWLRTGVADGSIRVNEPGAMVHGVEEGLLLVSPRVFREFSKEIREAELAVGGRPPADPEEFAKWLQRQVLREAWHLRDERGVNILAFRVMRGDRAVSRLCGVVIRDPARFLDSAPPVNPALVRAIESRELA
jgi:hypothetical protein